MEMRDPYLTPSGKMVIPVGDDLCFKNIFIFKNFIGVQLIYNVVLVSGVQQNESVIHIHITTLFLDSFSI